jgi:fermentation-respiration switch protein FrsA (DUF1100 family)
MPTSSSTTTPTTRTNVSFDSAGITIAGHLYTAGGRADEPGPALVVGHPGSGVKEQAAGHYASRLAQEGFTTLAFDAAYQGESEGLPRGLESPAQRVEDIKAAVSFLTTRPEADPDRLGVLGICASGGYAVSAAVGDHRIKAVATVSGVNIADQFRSGADGAQDPAVFQQMLDAAAGARTAEARGEGVQTFRLFPGSADLARQAGGQHGVEGYEYYCTARGEHDRSTKELPWQSVDLMATFDAFRFVRMLAPRPLLQIVGREAVTAWMAIGAHQEAAEPKRLHWIEGASHVDLYDKEQYVAPAVEQLAAFFTTNINA